MITQTTTNIRAAHTIEEMRQVARNQITQKIYEMGERIKHLQNLKNQIADIVDFDSYERVAADCIYYGDAADLSAVIVLANEYGTMTAGNYF